MSIGIIISDVFKNHDTSEMHGTVKYFHPESVKRIEAIKSSLENKELWNKSQKIPLRKITAEELTKVHTPDYINSVKEFCLKGGGRIDEDTVTCPESYDVSLLAAGSSLQAVDYVMTNQLKKVFCLIRPPGHHALPDSSMGFCLFSNLSLGVVYALSKYKLDRIMIIDWDAHHGNGTERIFYNSNKVLTVSWHQFPFWPFTGDYKDTGANEGVGYNINIPVPEAFTDEIYIETFDKIVAPAARKFKPQLIMLAAGYDAHYSDTVAGLNATDTLYEYLSKKIMALADELCDGKLIATLEGGYNVEALVKGVTSTLNFMHKPELDIKSNWVKETDENREKIKEIINNIVEIQPLLN